MKRIATPNRAVDKFAAGKDGFRAAVPAVSSATEFSDLWFNHVQEAVMRTIEQAGLVQSDTDFDQFVTALNTTYARLNNAPFAVSPTAPTPAQFDSTTKLATMEAVQRALGNRAGEVVYIANGSINPSDAGKVIIVSSATAFALTLPSISSVRAGAELFFINSNSGPVTINRFGVDIISNGGTSYTSVVIPSNGSLRLVCSNNSWSNASGDAGLALSALFSSSFSTNGYQKLPSGLIIQWGTTGIIAAGGSLVVTRPITYPGGHIWTSGGNAFSAGSTSATSTLGIAYGNNSQFTIFAVGNAGQPNCTWMSLGY